MNGTVLLELTAILALILLNGLFASAEIALLTAGRGRLQNLADGGDKKARMAIRLMSDPDQFLSTVQVGITLVGTFAAVFGGASIVRNLEKFFASTGLPVLASQAGLIALLLYVPAISFVNVVIGELVPKRLAMQNAVATARFVSPLMLMMQSLARPLVWSMASSSEMIVRLFGNAQPTANKVSLQDIRSLIDLGLAEGLLQPLEQQLAVGAIQLADRQVRQIMRPRMEVDAADVNTPPEEVVGVVSMAGYSRLPVYEQSLDNIIGFVHLKDVLRQHYMGWPLSLRKLTRKALFVPETMQVSVLLKKFQDGKQRLAIVVDEFGSTVGIATMGDILSALVRGVEASRENDGRYDLVRRADGSWLVDGTVPLSLLLGDLAIPRLEALAPPKVNTTAGLILHVLGRMPKVGEVCIWEQLSLEVVDLDGNRIDRLLVRILPDK